MSIHASPTDKVARRNFLKTVGIAAAGLGWAAKSYANIVGANDRIRVGFIGVGDMGNNHLNAFNDLKEQDNLEAVAVADCWKSRADAGAGKIGADRKSVV